MAKVLVTGASGHLGNNLVRMLLAQGREVRVMVRRSSNLKGLEGLAVERVYGDLLDAEAIDRAVKGCSRVYHAAAAFLFWARDEQTEIIEPTVAGSEAVLKAAAKHGVERTIYVSTSATVGLGSSPRQCRDESYFATKVHTPYFRAELAAEEAALEFQRETELPIVFVLPGLILGPGFYRLTSSLRLVGDYLNRPGMPYFDGGFSVVDVEDVARGALLAEKNGHPGERYILAGENVTVKNFYEMIAELTGLPPPRFRGTRSVMTLAALLMECWSRLFGGTPIITRDQVKEFLGGYSFLSSEKARRELAYDFMPCRKVLARTISWLVEQGFVKESRRKAIHLKVVTEE